MTKLHLALPLALKWSLQEEELGQCMKRWVEAAESTSQYTGVEMLSYGDQVPPYILYKAQHLYGIWTLNGPNGSLYGVSTSGWMQKPNFYSWFVKGFLPKLRQLNLIPQNNWKGLMTHPPLYPVRTVMIILQKAVSRPVIQGLFFSLMGTIPMSIWKSSRWQRRTM